jgi:hypothetical protein
MPTEDRRVLEKIIFPHYRNIPLLQTILFVGCESYTAHYQQKYFPDHDYWTIDRDATRRRHGAKQHVITRLEELDRHFPAGFFDLVICNGIYGWGLDSAQDCDAALAQCHFCLANSGHLILGWNDVPERDPAPLSRIAGIENFARYSLPALGGWQYLTNTPNRHTFNFYQKVEGGRSGANAH